MPTRPSQGERVVGSVPSPPNSASQRAAVLVVEDHQANLMAMGAVLEGLDVDMVPASNGEEALWAVLRQEFALVLLDIRLPELGGFEVAELMRQHESTRHVPIIFVTAHDQSQRDIHRGYALGAVDFVFKPFAPDILRAKVQVFVQLREQTRRVAQLEREAADRRLADARQEWDSASLREQVEAQRDIAAALEAADRRKDEFLAVLAHELRNPLAPVVTGLALVRLQTQGMESVSRTCEVMDRQVRHLVRLIDDLLDVSRIARGKVQLRREPIDVRACIEQAIETQQPAAEDAEHRIHVELPERPVICIADSVRLTQVVANLLANAVRYTPRAGNIYVSANMEGPDVLIHVRDDGIGISKEMLPRIFETFVQERIGDAGLGLGLTLVKEIVTRHGGSVSVRSEGAGLGSEFEVRLSRSESARMETAAATDRDCGSGSARLRILVVEDQPDISQMTRVLLESWGHEVDVAHTGFEGVTLAITLRPDVILLDIGLPDIDGYTVARQIRADLGDACGRLIALTGFGQAEDRERAREAGFDDYLVKPAPPEALRRALSP
jgi:signal transduction histidine kinase